MGTPLPPNTASFTAARAATATGGKWTAEGPSTEGVSTDTRTLRSGMLFVALKGDNFDGHDHLVRAKEAGAVAAIVERIPQNIDAILPLLVVDSTLEALGALAKEHVGRWRRAGSGDGRTVVAITGSAGKTTTKMATAALLSAKMDATELLVAPGNLNNRIGVPMVALSLANQQVAVFEFGTSMPGEIACLTQMIEPDVAVLTLIAEAHTGGLGSIEAVEDEKSAIFGSARLKVAIGNADDPRVARAVAATAPQATVRTYGTAQHADVQVTDWQWSGAHDSAVCLSAGTRRFESIIGFLGYAGALASAAALTVVEAVLSPVTSAELSLGLSRTEAADGQVGGNAAGRFSVRAATSGLWIIDDTYNANPASMKASLESAGQLVKDTGRRFVVALGAMRELGDRSEALHREVGRGARELGATVVCGIDEEARALVGDPIDGIETHLASDSEAALAWLTKRAEPNDLILVKGSRSIGCERIVEGLLEVHGGEASPEDGRATATRAGVSG